MTKLLDCTTRDGGYCTNWIYLLTCDNETAKEISNRLGKYTISSNRISTSTRLEQLDYNISNDKSLIGRELLMPDELMRFKLGEGLFMATRQYPIKSNFIPISNYGFKIKMSVIPKKQKDFKIDCFNLDEFRKKKIQDEEDKKVDLV